MAIGVVSKSGYAEHRGCSPAYVSKLIRLKKLAAPALMADGTINIALADQMLGPAALDAQAQLPQSILPGGPVYSEERARREAAQARLAEMEVAKREGEQMPRTVISAAAATVFERAIVRFMDLWPDLSVEFARMTDPAAIADLGQVRTRAVMAGLHEEFLRNAARRAAG